LSFLIPALLTFFFALSLSPAHALASVLSGSSFSGDVYSQTLWRNESRIDRSSGIFHETRARGSYDVFKASSSILKIDFGSYVLGEWANSSMDQSSPQNVAVSPFLGMRLRDQISGDDWTFSGAAVFEGRLREPLSEGAKASGVKGWDPRTSAVVGFWWMSSEPKKLNPFADLYGDLVYAPKFSNALLSTLLVRAGTRSTWEAIFFDGYAEFFSQNAPSLELGTKRSEARLGVALGHPLREGSAQIRVWHGFPLDILQGTALDTRSRTEALLLVGFAL
jgi:hypothetical protein